MPDMRLLFRDVWISLYSEFKDKNCAWQGYERVPIRNGFSLNHESFVISNDKEISFSKKTRDEGTMTHLAIWEFEHSREPLFCGPLSSPKTISSGDQALFLPYSITIKLIDLEK